MIDFDNIINAARSEALDAFMKRVISGEASEDKNLDPEVRDLLSQNKINIILVEEMVKSALKHYHKEVTKSKKAKFY